MATRIKDMTKGKPTKLILTFALPLMLGSVFQQTYTMVDSIIVGRVVGVEALAALGVSDWVNWMMVGLVMGFAHGFTILISQRFGAEDYVGLRNCCHVHNSFRYYRIILARWFGFARSILQAIQTPENIIDILTLYVSIYSLGYPMIMAYNMASSILRGMGIPKHPYGL